MENNHKKTKIYSITNIVLAVLIAAFSLYDFKLEKIDLFYLLLLAGTVFIAVFINIQLPRIKIHLSFAEVAIFYTILMYGIGPAIILGAIESFFSAFSLRRKGINIKTQTLFLNAAMTIISTFSAGWIALKVFPAAGNAVSFENYQFLALVLSLICLIQFSVSSVLVAKFTSLKCDKSFFQVLYENCFTALAMYTVAAGIAGLFITAVSSFSSILLFLTLSVAVIVYVTYRRFVSEIKETSAKAEAAERERAEQAEKHVYELQHYIKELESSSSALKLSETKLRYTAFHDSLTDLPNRNKFLERLQFLIEKNKHSTGTKICSFKSEFE